MIINFIGVVFILIIDLNIRQHNSKKKDHECNHLDNKVNVVGSITYYVF